MTEVNVRVMQLEQDSTDLEDGGGHKLRNAGSIVPGTITM